MARSLRPELSARQQVNIRRSMPADLIEAFDHATEKMMQFLPGSNTRFKLKRIERKAIKAFNDARKRKIAENLGLKTVR